MAYAEYLKNLLAPLGIYDLAKGSFSEAMVYAAGQALDQTERSLERTERESLVPTALEEGLERRETLFARRPVAETVEDRRAAITALMQIDADSLTPEAINRTISGCGIPAKALEVDTGHLRVIFPGIGGVPPGFDEIQQIILDILPCHLEVEFYFRYMTWTECEEAGYTWASVEQQEFTWERFELMGGKTK